MLMRWYLHPAEPWQFWWPQSGIAGGVITAALMLLALWALVSAA